MSSSKAWKGRKTNPSKGLSKEQNYKSCGETI
jgi:hypothetical protein